MIIGRPRSKLAVLLASSNRTDWCLRCSLKNLFLLLLLFVATSFFFLPADIYTKQPQCNKNPEKRSPFPLFYDDFGSKQEFKIEFSNFNMSYEMRKPTKDVCAEQNVTTLILIISSPDNFYARDQIRKTWMYSGDNPLGYHALFIIGRRYTKGLDDKIKIEQDRFGDIIRYDADDTYELLHVKTHASFSWQQAFCPKAQYLLKTDDDTIVHLPRLDHFIKTEFEYVRKEQHPSSFFCHRWSRLQPFRDPRSRYYVSFDEYPDNYYPTFCQGCSYLVTTQAVSTLLNHTKNVRVIHLEDVLFTGLVAKNASVYHHAAKAFGQDYGRMCVEGIPYLSTYIGVPPWKLDMEYRKLKDLDCIGPNIRRRFKHGVDANKETALTG